MKPHHPLPPGVVARLGSTAYRLPERYGTVFLMPPHFRSYVASDAGTLREYDLTTGEPGRVIVSRETNTRFCGISADGKRIVVHTPVGYEVRRVADQHPLLTVPHDPTAVGCELAPNGRRLAVLLRNPCTEQREADCDMEACYVRTVVVHTVGSRSTAREIRPLLNFALVPHFSPDGRYLTVTGEWQEEYDDQPRPFEGNTLLQVWDVATGREVFRYTPPDGERCDGVQFGGGTLLVTAGYPARPTVLFDLTTGEVIRRFRSTMTRGHHSLSPDGRVLLGLLDQTHELVRQDARTGQVIDRTRSPFGKLDNRYATQCVNARSDGGVAVLQMCEQTVYAWTAPDGEPLTRHVGGSVPIQAIKFTPDGREVLTVGKEPVVRRWDAQTGNLLREIKLPASMKRRMALVRFAPDDWLLAWSRDGGADYNLRTRKVNLSERAYEHAVWGETLSADGWLVTLTTHVREVAATELWVKRVASTPRQVIDRFDAMWPAAAYDRGRVLLVYDNRAQTERTLACIRLTGKRARREWSRSLPVGREFRDTFPYNRDVDSSKVAQSGTDGVILWAPEGETALVLPQRERVPCLIDPTTGNTLHDWPSAIHGPHAVHPSLPLLATCSPHGNDLLLLDWQTGERRAVLMEQCYPHALAWSPDGTRLAAALPDGTALVFAPEVG